MAQQTFDQETGKKLLAQVREGMSVYDRLDKRIGTVKDLYLGAASAKAEARGEGPATAPPRDTGNEGLIQDIAKVFVPNELPKEVQQTLLREGFIRIDGGLLSSPRYALPEHIESISDDHVRLRITSDDLIKRA